MGTRSELIDAIAAITFVASDARLDGHITRTQHAQLIVALEPLLRLAGASWDDIGDAGRSRHTQQGRETPTV